MKDEIDDKEVWECNDVANNDRSRLTCWDPEDPAAEQESAAVLEHQEAEAQRGSLRAEDEDEEVVAETQMDDHDDDDARRFSSPDRTHSQTLPSFKGTLRAWFLIQSPHQQRCIHLLLLCMSLREQLTRRRPRAGNKKLPPKAAAAEFDFDGEERNVPPPSLGKRSDKKDRSDNKESKASSKKPKTDASKSSSKMPQTYKPSTKATESSAPEYGTLNLVVENPSVEDPCKR